MFTSRLARMLLICAWAALTAAPLAAQVKIGIVNTQKALLDTADMQKAQKGMEAKFKPQQDEIEKLQKELQQIQQQLTTLAGKLTPQAEQELQFNGQRKQKDLQRLSEDLQADVEMERNDILRQAGARMQAILTKLAEEKALDVLIDVTNTVYFKPALDLTAEATAAYDKAHPAK
ncbi:MAG: OmpH family outer membrane protein [Acidimicrobiia bacterium]|nr:OmpH family outer membrane protein [Acidimicrobiia bacterium]